MMETQPLFPPSMAVMIAAAEDQGALADTLKHLGSFYHERTLHGVTVMRELMEPILLILIGMFLIMVLVTFYMPLFSIPRAIPSF